MVTAKEWGITPSQWDALPADDKKEMMFLIRTQNSIQSWSEFQASLKQRK